MMYRRTRTEMTAAAHEIHECEVEGVKFDFLAAPVEVVVENGRAVGLKAQRMALGEPDESGRRWPEPVKGSDYFTPADTILMAIGQDVDGTALGEAHLSTNKWGHIAIDEATMATDLPGVFAGGDCASGRRHRHRGGGGRPPGRLRHPCVPQRRRPARHRQGDLHREAQAFAIGATAKSSARMAEMPVLEGQARVAAFRTSSHIGRDDNEGAFAEVELGFADDVAQTEAERCLQCVCQAAGCARCRIFAGVRRWRHDLRRQEYV